MDAPLDPANKIFASSHNIELFKVVGDKKDALVKNKHLEVYTLDPTSEYPILSAVAVCGDVRWQMKIDTHTMRSKSSTGEPTYIFSSVLENDPDIFYCVVFKKGTPTKELEVLEQVLIKLSNFHQSERKPDAPLPVVDPNAINEVMRKGAEDTQMLFNMAGQAMHDAFLAGVEMHKKYAPKPKGEVQVSPDIRDGITKTKQATAAGQAVAKGVATGMQAATAEIGTSLAQTVSSAASGGKNVDGTVNPASKSAVAANAVGGVGMELLRDIASVRDAMVNAVGSAWSGARDATVEVMNYQYGAQVASCAKDSAEVVEGIAGMGLAMKFVQPTQVALTSAKETAEKMENKKVLDANKDTGAAKKQLDDERAALERERAALAAERAALEASKTGRGQAPADQPAPQQQKKGPFGFPLAFA